MRCYIFLTTGAAGEERGMAIVQNEGEPSAESGDGAEGYVDRQLSSGSTAKKTDVQLSQDPPAGERQPEEEEEEVGGGSEDGKRVEGVKEDSGDGSGGTLAIDEAAREDVAMVGIEEEGTAEVAREGEQGPECETDPSEEKSKIF